MYINKASGSDGIPVELFQILKGLHRKLEPMEKKVGKLCQINRNYTI